jgi:hypothetical protein
MGIGLQVVNPALAGKWRGTVLGARESSLFEPKRVALGEFRGFTALCVAESAANFLDSLDFFGYFFHQVANPAFAGGKVTKQGIPRWSLLLGVH